MKHSNIHRQLVPKIVSRCRVDGHPSTRAVNSGSGNRALECVASYAILECGSYSCSAGQTQPMLSSVLYKNRPN